MSQILLIKYLIKVGFQTYWARWLDRLSESMRALFLYES